MHKRIASVEWLDFKEIVEPEIGKMKVPIALKTAIMALVEYSFKSYIIMKKKREEEIKNRD
jgi:hypothetical protein